MLEKLFAIEKAKVQYNVVGSTVEYILPDPVFKLMQNVDKRQTD